MIIVTCHADLEHIDTIYLLERCKLGALAKGRRRLSTTFLGYWPHYEYFKLSSKLTSEPESWHQVPGVGQATWRHLAPLVHNWSS